MEKDKNKDPNWLLFRKIFDCFNTNEEETHTSLKELIPVLDRFLSLAPSIIFIIDYSTMQYLYFNENMNDFLGEVADEYLQGGLKFAIDNVYPDDREILVTQIFPHVKEFLSKVPPETYKDYKFSFNFRYRRKDGTYQHFIQHSTYLPDKIGNMRYNFGMGNNLPNADKIKISLAIEKKEKGSYRQVSIVEFNATTENIFSKRECEILKLIYQGLSSTAIAFQLHLSEHTINNHRKKMLQKSGTTNTPALINYAMKNGFI